MPGVENFVQRVVHALEQGGFAVWVRRGLIAAAVAALTLFYFNGIRGLATSQAMDQAQIGREIASGHGWRTKLIRPLAAGQLQRNGKDVVRDIGYDTYEAPLPPLVDALALLLIKSHWKMSPRDLIYIGDKAVIAASMLLFLAALGVLYFTAARLFDARLALLGCGLVLVCDTFWQYALSGLPQMLMLFLFHCTLYALVRAVQAQDLGGGGVGIWLAAAGAGFGLLALSHALTIWIFVPALIFSIFYFRPRGWAAVIVLGAFLILYTPWLARTYLVCGNPGGTAIYAVFDEIHHPEAGHMRRNAADLEGVSPGFFRNKIVGNLSTQFNRIFQYLGWNVVALFFFASLLHQFKRHDTAIARWMLLAMWAGAVVGMLVYGLPEEQGVAANQLHLLFTPMMVCYGLAFLLVQWNRWNLEYRLLRIAFLVVLFILCGLPTIFAIVLPTTKPTLRWPPYVPPYISVLNDWMKPDEIVTSDIPWAIAWYADRRSLWLPATIKEFTDANDYNTYGGPINGLYLTPASGSQNTLADILKGEYKDWAPLILRSVNLEKFPLKWATLLGIEKECVFFSDHDRQNPTAAE